MSNLPKGWKLVQLNDIVKFNNGKGHEQYIDDNGEYIVVNSKFISTNGEIRKYSNENLSPLKKGDITLVMSDIPNGRALAKCYLIEEDNKYTLNQRICSLEVKNENNEFLFYKLNRNQYFLKFNDGVNQTNLRKNEVLECPIELPPIEEQKKIADILSTVDKKIAFVEENINATEELKKGLMQKLLTEGIGHTEFKDSELGRIPESWEVIPFIELADKNIKHSFTGGPFGSDLKSEHYTDIGVRVIQLQNIGDGYFINNDFVYVSEEKAELLKSCQIYPNDIILAKMAEPVARACLIPDFESKYVMCSDGIRLKVDNSKFNTEFIFYSINYDNFRKIAVARSNGTTRLRIGLSALKSIPILIPPLEEQKQIAEILSTVDKKLENLKEKKQSFEELKKGLMQKLLTGEVRV